MNELPNNKSSSVADEDKFVCPMHPHIRSAEAENCPICGMNIGDVAERSGVPAKTIRYYEDIGLVKPTRGRNGYREFEERELHRLEFIGRARSLGFTIEDCRDLLALYDDESRTSAEVKRVAEQNLQEIDAKISGLKAMNA